MKLTKPQVKHISDLARLKLSDAEIERFRRQLSSILGYVELLNEADTSKVAPTAQTTGLKSVYWEDKPQKETRLTPRQVLANAPETKNGLIKTKAVL